MDLKSISFLLLAPALAYADVLPASPTQVDPLVEVRQCGVPQRLADGSIRRRADVLYAYKKAHPCPITGKSTGACTGWSVNHIIPLAQGGCDSVANMMWVPNQIKSCATPYCIDRWEREYYGTPHGVLKPLQ